MESIFHNRQYARVNWHNYNVGLFFVTVSTFNKIHYFGTIVDGSMAYTEIGKRMVDDILNLGSHFQDVEVDEWIIMPNHVHIILKIGSGDYREGLIESTNRLTLGKESKRSRLSSIIGGLKSGVKRYANQNNFLFDWNPGFYEHIIRTPESYKNIKYYIRNNIKKWDGQKHQY